MASISRRAAGCVLLRRERERARVVRQRGHHDLLLRRRLQGEDRFGCAEDRVREVGRGLDRFQHRELRDHRVGQRRVELGGRIECGRAVAAHLRRDQHEVDVVRVVGRLVHRVRGRGLEVLLVDGHCAFVDLQRLLVAGRYGSRCAPACARYGPRRASTRPGDARAAARARAWWTPRPRGCRDASRPGDSDCVRAPAPARASISAARPLGLAPPASQ